MTTELSEAQKESLRKEAKLGRGTRAERETLREQARGVRREREAKEIEAVEYGQSLWDILTEQVEAGEILPERRLEIWQQTSDYVLEKGLTPALPYFTYIRDVYPGVLEERKSLEDYERIKPTYLASTDMSYWDKVKALVRLHPQGARADIFRQIKNEVFPTITEKDIDPGILRSYRSRYEKSVTDEPYAQWLIHQGLASLEGRAGAGDGDSERFGGRTTARPEGFEFEPAFEKERLGLGGSQIWKNWYEARFGLQIRRFKGQVEDQTEETWAAFLKKQTPKLREEWWKVGAFRRGERPSVQQPRIRTVRF
ncbi:hypothetical protein LCGC14_0845680 [marine sediment metagenome]|uniref:Uncharacterized protein n=1 Tax=marine sediment metagenome TaxID=412755 RepID=A0A0F9PX24_9ZZZZ